MALAKPFSYQISQGWGHSANSAEPEGWAQLGRFWYERPIAAAGGANFKQVVNFHPALDLAAASGTPILASESGVVTAAGHNPSSPVSGLRIRIRIRPGSYYGHGHLLRLAPGIVVGSHVKRGQHIADVGQSGTPPPSGPHSHFYVELIVPNTTQVMLYDPNLFWVGGANANDPRIKPL